MTTSLASSWWMVMELCLEHYQETPEKSYTNLQLIYPRNTVNKKKLIKVPFWKNYCKLWELFIFFKIFLHIHYSLYIGLHFVCGLRGDAAISDFKNNHYMLYQLFSMFRERRSVSFTFCPFTYGEASQLCEKSGWSCCTAVHIQRQTKHCWSGASWIRRFQNRTQSVRHVWSCKHYFVIFWMDNNIIYFDKIFWGLDCVWLCNS